MARDVVFRREIQLQLEACAAAGVSVPKEIREFFPDLALEVLEQVYNEGYLRALAVVAIAYKDINEYPNVRLGFGYPTSASIQRLQKKGQTDERAQQQGGSADDQQGTAGAPGS